MKEKPTKLQVAVAAATTGFFLSLSPQPVATEKFPPRTLSPQSVTTGRFPQHAGKPVVLVATEVITTSQNSVIQLSTNVTVSSDFSFANIATNGVDNAYESLKDAWFNDPSLLISSFSDDFTRSDDFRGLVQLGKAIYPYILADLSPETAIRWDLVLTEIHGESVVPEREWGKPDKIASRWIKFLRLSI